ncbi:sperm microtubule inner protein 11 [Centroberyx gerrardi]|uniref:sperm microtubule inner protein 11 n=1 Tax=Centroberyx gerrardi TaxID=166262 RepID=UPI003AAB63C7
MAFFGITNLGYQNPIGDKMIVNPRGSPHSQDSSDIHHGSQERYREMVKRVQTPRSPNQLYLMPVTDSQQYGWLLSKEKSPESWAQIERFPRKNSEMTKFVKEMSMTDREFSLF